MVGKEVLSKDVGRITICIYNYENPNQKKLRRSSIATFHKMLASLQRYPCWRLLCAITGKYIAIGANGLGPKYQSHHFLDI